MEFAAIRLVTKRGEVVVRFKDDGTFFDIRAELPCNWDDKTWRRERTRLVRRARRICEKVWSINSYSVVCRVIEKEAPRKAGLDVYNTSGAFVVTPAENEEQAGEIVCKHLGGPNTMVKIISVDRIELDSPCVFWANEVE